jgi:hypothetical protein
VWQLGLAISGATVAAISLQSVQLSDLRDDRFRCFLRMEQSGNDTIVIQGFCQARSGHATDQAATALHGLLRVLVRWLEQMRTEASCLGLCWREHYIEQSTSFNLLNRPAREVPSFPCSEIEEAVRQGGQQHRLTAPHLHVPCCSSLVSFQRVQTSAGPDSEVTLQIAFDVANSVGSSVVCWPEHSLISVVLTPANGSPLHPVSISLHGPNTSTFVCAAPCPAQYRRCRRWAVQIQLFSGRQAK